VTVRMQMWRVLSFHAEEEAMSYAVAGIDVHKRILMVAVAEVSATEGDFECRINGGRTAP
jgi:hypothetical protein